MVPLLLLFLTFPNFNHGKINSLDDLKWRYRVLVLNQGNTTNYKKEEHKFNIDLEDRDLLVIYLRDGRALFGQKRLSYNFSKSLKGKVKNYDGKAILIGKDGLIKHVYSLDVDYTKIFYDIDQMPMRRFELKRRSK